MLKSKCCKSNALFSFGYAHGIYLDKNNKHTGICSECKKHTEFNEKKECKDDNNRSN